MSTKTVRRSVALPRQLVDEVTSVTPEPLRGNFNRLVIVALEQFVAREKAKAFEEAMNRMGADPAIQRENAAISGEFEAAEADGLGDD